MDTSIIRQKVNALACQILIVVNYQALFFLTLDKYFCRVTKSLNSGYIFVIKFRVSSTPVGKVVASLEEFCEIISPGV